MNNVSPWIIRTLTLPPLLASLVPHNFRRYHKPPYIFIKTTTIPTYYGIVGERSNFNKFPTHTQDHGDA